MPNNQSPELRLGTLDVPINNKVERSSGDLPSVRHLADSCISNWHRHADSLPESEKFHKEAQIESFKLLVEGLDPNNIKDMGAKLETLPINERNAVLELYRRRLVVVTEAMNACLESEDPQKQKLANMMLDAYTTTHKPEEALMIKDKRELDLAKEGFYGEQFRQALALINLADKVSNEPLDKFIENNNKITQEKSLLTNPLYNKTVIMQMELDIHKAFFNNEASHVPETFLEVIPGWKPLNPLSKDSKYQEYYATWAEQNAKSQEQNGVGLHVVSSLPRENLPGFDPRHIPVQLVDRPAVGLDADGKKVSYNRASLVFAQEVPDYINKGILPENVDLTKISKELLKPTLRNLGEISFHSLQEVDDFESALANALQSEDGKKVRLLIPSRGSNQMSMMEVSAGEFESIKNNTEGIKNYFRSKNLPEAVVPSNLAQENNSSIEVIEVTSLKRGDYLNQLSELNSIAGPDNSAESVVEVYESFLANLSDSSAIRNKAIERIKQLGLDHKNIDLEQEFTLQLSNEMAFTAFSLKSEHQNIIKLVELYGAESKIVKDALADFGLNVEKRVLALSNYHKVSKTNPNALLKDSEALVANILTPFKKVPENLTIPEEFQGFSEHYASVVPNLDNSVNNFLKDFADLNGIESISYYLKDEINVFSKLTPDSINTNYPAYKNGVAALNVLRLGRPNNESSPVDLVSGDEKEALLLNLLVANHKKFNGWTRDFSIAFNELKMEMYRLKSLNENITPDMVNDLVNNFTKKMGSSVYRGINS